MTATGQGWSGGRLEVEGLSKKEKGLMDMGKSVVIVGGKKRMTVLNGNGKGTIKIVR